MAKNTIWWVVGIGVAAYLYFTQFAGKLNWTLQNVSVNQNGLITVLDITMLLASGSSTSLILSNMTVTVIYNGNTIGIGTLASTTINPGNNSITFPVNLSDLTLISDIANAIQNPGTAITITIKGSGVADGVPASFSENYSFTS